jgi:S1-C subfamily serine protease
MKAPNLPKADAPPSQANPMAEHRYTAWQVLGFLALILALVAGACSGGLLIGFSLGRVTARPADAYPPRPPELPLPELPNLPVPPAGQVYLGVRYVPVTRALARQEGLSVETGVLLRHVDQGSPASAAGLLRGDVITEVDGLALDSRHDLRDVIAAYAPGETVPLSVVRGDQTLVLTATLGAGDAD